MWARESHEEFSNDSKGLMSVHLLSSFLDRTHEHSYGTGLVVVAV